MKTLATIGFILTYSVILLSLAFDDHRMLKSWALITTGVIGQALCMAMVSAYNKRKTHVRNNNNPLQ